MKSIIITVVVAIISSVAYAADDYSFSECILTQLHTPTTMSLNCREDDDNIIFKARLVGAIDLQQPVYAVGQWQMDYLGKDSSQYEDYLKAIKEKTPNNSSVNRVCHYE